MKRGRGPSQPAKTTGHRTVGDHESLGNDAARPAAHEERAARGYERYDLENSSLSLKTFLLDRIYYIAAFYACLILVILVITLDVMPSGVYLNWSSILYMFILGTVGITVAIAYDYLRQKPFYRQIDAALIEKDRKLDNVLRIDSGSTLEQQAVQLLLHDHYKAYLDKLTKYRNQQEQHRHFTNQWVHHMKTPVAVIDLLIQQAEQSVEKTTAAMQALELFRSIREENERIANGLEMMLHTARLEKFELDSRMEQVDLPELIRGVINIHKKSLIRWSIFPKIVCAEPSAAVETDRKWLDFVIGQIVSNAIKYSKPVQGDKQLLFTLSRSGGGWKLDIADQGVGIAGHDVPRVFDAFFTGENGRAAAESTGMGLFLAKQVCDRLGHRIAVRSEPGAGTTVTLEFEPGSIQHGLKTGL